jgi:hypothetical protein
MDGWTTADDEGYTACCGTWVEDGLCHGCLAAVEG